MPEYLVRYQIETHDSDGPEVEERSFSASSDNTAWERAYKIAADRATEIQRKGGACITAVKEVLKATITYTRI